jgi:hypothetical protein
MKRLLIAVAVAGAIASGGAMAGNTTSGAQHELGTPAFVPVQYYQYYQHRTDDRQAQINEREARIEARIQRGLADGRLTEWEARRLQRQLNDVQAKERAFMGDGWMNRGEFAELSRDLDQLGDNVRAELRDEQRRYSYYRER